MSASCRKKVQQGGYHLHSVAAVTVMIHIFSDSFFGAQCLFKRSDSLNAKESRMHWKKRQKQIQYLQAKHGNARSLATEFPDLKIEPRTAPCSNGMRGSTARRVLPSGMKQFPVGHCHKQGYELIIPGTDLQWMGGKKP